MLKNIYVYYIIEEINIIMLLNKTIHKGWFYLIYLSLLSFASNHNESIRHIPSEIMEEHQIYSGPSILLVNKSAANIRIKDLDIFMAIEYSGFNKDDAYPAISRLNPTNRNAGENLLIAFIELAINSVSFLLKNIRKIDFGKIFTINIDNILTKETVYTEYLNNFLYFSGSSLP